jgi:hypothetical protein
VADDTFTGEDRKPREIGRAAGFEHGQLQEFRELLVRVGQQGEWKRATLSEFPLILH